MRKGLFVTLLTIMLGTFLLSGCSGKDTAAEGQKSVADIKISAITGVSWAPLFIASSEGFFEKNGLNVEFLTPGGPKGFQAMHAGECQFSMLSQEPLLIAQEKGIRSTIIATMLKSRVYGIIARPDIKSIADLKGAAIYGSDPGSAPYTFTCSVLQEAGLDPTKDVTFMQMQDSAAVTALEKGEIKAAFINMFKRPELKDMAVNVLVDATRQEDSLKYLGTNDFPAEMLCTTEDYAKKHPEVCQKVVNAIIEAQAWIQAHSDKEVAESISHNFAALDVDVLSKEVAIMRDIYSPNCYISESGENAVVNMCVNTGLIKKPIAYNEIVDMTFVNNRNQ